jgi:hypothetical protein
MKGTARVCCPACSGLGELTKRQNAQLHHFLDLAAWARGVQKRLEAEGFAASAEAFAAFAAGMQGSGFTLTDNDRKFLSGLNIAAE